MTKLNYRTDENGVQRIESKNFENTIFTDMAIAPQQGRNIELRNIRFENCKTSPGTCVVTDGVTLDDVVFSNFHCGDALRIASEAHVNKVQVIGNQPSTLIVQPRRSSTYAIREHVGDYAFDVSRFSGHVNIYGFHAAAIRHDADRHVVISTERINDVDWKGLGIGMTSFWRIILKKLQNFNATEGVFSLPAVGDTSSLKKERLTLVDLGICK